LICLFDNVKARNSRSARCRSQQGGQHSYCSALARAVRPEKAEYFAGFHFKVDALDGMHVAEMTHQVFGNNRRIAHCKRLNDGRVFQLRRGLSNSRPNSFWCCRHIDVTHTQMGERINNSRLHSRS